MSPEISLCIYIQLIFYKIAMSTDWGKTNLLNKQFWVDLISINKNEVEPLLFTVHKNELRKDYYLNIRAKFTKQKIKRSIQVNLWLS